MMAQIKIESALKAVNDTVWTDPNQLKQVFLNVIMNAADAMGSEKTPYDTGHKALTIKSLAMEDSIELRFTDTGPGISEQELGHIFDPFYTTKEPGKVTGLGLSVCYRIIEGLGGAIRAESAIGKGTTIIIDIPLYHSINKSKEQ
jgi:two-component system NtrC family sensor kinase